MPSFEIPDNAVRIDLKPGVSPSDPLTGNTSYTITNRGPALGGRLSMQIKGGGKPEWFTVKDGKERSFAAGETQTIEVAIAVPTATPPGEYGFRLRIVSVIDTDNDHTESAASTMVVPRGKTPPVPDHFPWWIVIVVLIVLAAIVTFVVTAFVKPGFLRPKTAPVPPIATGAPQTAGAGLPATNCRLTYAVDGGVQRRYLMDGPPLDRLRTGDFDGDGITDLFTAVPDGKGAFQWLYAPGGKGPFRSLGTGQDLPSLYFGDFDGDGVTDVLFQKPNSGGEFDWLLSSGGTKTPEHLRYGHDLATVGIGDFDGDGTTDVLGDYLRSDGYYQWVIYKGGRGDGVLVAYANPVRTLRFGDFNKDGKADALVYYADNGGTWALSAGATGNYQILRTGVPGFDKVALADVDGDGRTDLISGNPDANGQYQWFYWSGDETVPGPINLAKGPDPVKLIYGNFDGNGKADFLMADCK
jgi:hypothetical protein